MNRNRHLNLLLLSLTLLGLGLLSACGDEVGREVPPKLSSVCSDPNPQGCAVTGCPAGQVCQGDDPAPSSCFCDASLQTWSCTPDLSGRGHCVAETPAKTCTDPNPQGCVHGAQCPKGQICKHDVKSCLSSACACDPQTGSWLCTPDCMGGQCVPEEPEKEDCLGPNPQGCLSPSDCPAGQTCNHDNQGCLSSACACDPQLGTWLCTPDCMGGQCVLDSDPLACGPGTGNVCPSGEVCNVTSCAAGATGHCVRQPTLQECLIDLGQPVCGCDGQTYGKDCERLRFGAAFAHGGDC